MTYISYNFSWLHITLLGAGSVVKEIVLQNCSDYARVQPFRHKDWPKGTDL
jgi:hypothetical protein